MDLSQRKLTREEWNSVELPVSQEERNILQMLMDGYNDLNIKQNTTQTLLGYLKMDQSDVIDKYLFVKYIMPRFANSNQTKIAGVIKTAIQSVKIGKKIELKSADKMRLNNADARLSGFSMETADAVMFELFLSTLICLMLTAKFSNDASWNTHYYTLVKMQRNFPDISKLNGVMQLLVKNLLDKFELEFDIQYVVFNADTAIEGNNALLKYKTHSLYTHQKELFAALKSKNSGDPRLILYSAPTGTGKTMSPLALLSGGYRVIFMSAARHVGLALARAAISMGKRIAFAFGAQCADDVRLHFSAAKEYTRHKKSGGIFKVDNTHGENVELIICDLQSYLPAMYYMLSFNSREQLVMYWDEITISMDYEHHQLHSLIEKVWCDNVIPNVVLSSATLPELDDLGEVRASFMNKHGDVDASAIYSIKSSDCVKSITMLDGNGKIIVPHLFCQTADQVASFARYWRNNGTVLRYFDSKEIANFVRFMNQDEEHKSWMKMTAWLENNFINIDEVDMTAVKQYYMHVLENIDFAHWDTIHGEMKTQHQSRYNGSTKMVNITTCDAHTLTDGPTYYFTQDVDKIAQFCVQQAQIPVAVMDEISKAIDNNEQLVKRIDDLERTMEDMVKTTTDNGGADDDGKSKKTMQQRRAPRLENNAKLSELQDRIDGLKAEIRAIKLKDVYVPNKRKHLSKWSPDETQERKWGDPFTSDIDDETVIRIMQLPRVNNMYKILVLMGIGVFPSAMTPLIDNPDYLEIVKQLASQQKLYLIIADSDYMWGTNYQACHAYFGKDLKLTQDKILQGMGRVGRGNIQQHYTIRFRSIEQINQLMMPVESGSKLEVKNMNKLFQVNIE